MKKLVWMFSGQGSQYYRMGVDLFEEDPVFRREIQICDEHLRRILHTSLIDVVYPQKTTDRFSGFDRTLHTHPALFCIQYSLAQMLLAKGLRPDLLLGYSLGEIVSAAVANVLPFETALELVVDQARLFENAVAPGGMLAILESPSIVQENRALFAETQIAAHNYDRSFVIAGDSSSIDRIRQALERKDIMCQILPVRIPFHTTRMDSVETPFQERSRLVSLQKPRFPIASASEVAVLTSISAEFFWHAVRQPIRFKQTLEMLEGSGGGHYVDLGPSGTMASMVKYGLSRDSRSSFQAIMTPFNQASRNIRKVLAASGLEA